MQRPVIAVLVAGAAVVLAGGSVAAPERALAPPQTTSPPTIEGTFREGQVVRGTPGLWRNNPTSFRYTWQRCDATGQNCGTVSFGQNYLLTSRDVGRTVRVLVTASNRDGSSTVNSKPSPVIVPNVPAPANTAAPSITGTPRVGERLNANTGGWTNADSFTFQWQSCAGAACTNVEGATGQVYGVIAADQGRTLRVLVTATNVTGSVTAVSAPTAVVQPAARAGVASAARVSVADVSLPNRLVIARVEFVPRVIRSRSQPITMRVLVTDLRDRPVSGAFVFARGVPANRVSFKREHATRANGWVTLDFRPLRALPLRRGSTLVFFVRARKAGEPLLKGVSTNRLVQIRVAPR
jgi:hypothetical protein